MNWRSVQNERRFRVSSGSDKAGGFDRYRWSTYQASIR